MTAAATLHIATMACTSMPTTIIMGMLIRSLR